MKNIKLKNMKHSNKFKLHILILSVIMISSLVLGCNFISSSSTMNKHSNSNRKYYTSIMIKNGDTLWAIANNYYDYNNEVTNINEYIKEIKLVNGLSDEHINSGEYLTLPYYIKN
ncbi:LysM peptidoglycan-binding domain-containing protein [Anaerosacchariphilus polymeriproducens]|uniref:LysM peptidoglycan-binding domain-containing protein n=1 Tax=Anaerosacchariphilus polymeriproducens TaxID=1812858 RepID=A0A371AU05_9FIRM|nr:LysM peptidoglycan-binding domain-containing protein [Anaerosacchariphilus polymeriproducens]RDU23044.1 LysM peptidoglycan-binding domain-containing protein [Anaerosacchariphilus polymeriproducens]